MPTKTRETTQLSTEPSLDLEQLAPALGITEMLTELAQKMSWPPHITIQTTSDPASPLPVKITYSIPKESSLIITSEHPNGLSAHDCFVLEITHSSPTSLLTITGDNWQMFKDGVIRSGPHFTREFNRPFTQIDQIKQKLQQLLDRMSQIQNQNLSL